MIKISASRESSIIDILKSYFSDKEYGFVLLFGSYADGSYGEHSDVDIGVFFKEKVDYKTLGFDVAMLESKLEKKVDLIVLNALYKKNPLFAFEILQKHEPLMINDSKAYIDFKTSTQLYYLDHAPLLEQNRASLLYRIEKDKIGERNFDRTT